MCRWGIPQEDETARHFSRAIRVAFYHMRRQGGEGLDPSETNARPTEDGSARKIHGHL